MAVELVSQRAGAAVSGPQRAAPRERANQKQSLWHRSPLTYVALELACALSVFPFYWMLVVASRTKDAIGDVPPAMLPGGQPGPTVRPGPGNPDPPFPPAPFHT